MDRKQKRHGIDPRLWIELFMGLLAVGAIWLAFQPDSRWGEEASRAIWGIFVAEYAWRLFRAPHKWEFVRSNPVDLVAILPGDLLRSFRLFRMVRLLRLFRGLVVLWRVSHTVETVLRTNGLGYVLSGMAVLVLVCGAIMARIEPGIPTVVDGVWWGIVTSTTVGYGDIAPQTHEGRLIAILLMFAGIGTMGLLTGSIATHFIGVQGSKNAHIKHLQHELDGWDRMSGEERRELIRLLAALAADSAPPAAEPAPSPRE